MNEIPMNPKRILVVEDQPDESEYLEMLLQDAGFEVVLAKDGEEAVQRFKEDDRFSIIFTDLKMPGMGGMDLLKYVKQEHSTTCVNIITGSATIEGAVECVRLGACDYIAKPCNADEIIAMAYRCLRHHTHRQEAERLKETVTQLEELGRLKSEFVSNVSHELRTPLFSMGAALNLLLEDVSDKLEGTSKKLNEVIKNNFERLSQVVNNILNFSRIERGALRPNLQNIDLAELVQKTMEDLAPLFLQRKIRCEPPAVSARLDPIALQTAQAPRASQRTSSRASLRTSGASGSSGSVPRAGASESSDVDLPDRSLGSLRTSGASGSRRSAGGAASRAGASNAPEICEGAGAPSVPSLRLGAGAPRVVPSGHALRAGNYFVEVDPDQIRQVLINLLGNAAKFTPMGRSVGVRLSSEGERVCLCVWDTGPGIAPECHRRIFDRFYQVDGSLTREAGGAGIGLSIVKAIVEMHGGQAWVESELGKGSQFYASLPKHQTQKEGET